MAKKWASWLVVMLFKCHRTDGFGADGFAAGQQDQDGDDPWAI
jgi:hypothetical protein